MCCCALKCATVGRALLQEFLDIGAVTGTLCLGKVGFLLVASLGLSDSNRASEQPCTFLALDPLSC